MSIRLTEDLKQEALHIASLYQPADTPLFVGSTVWLGEGNDLDVVIFITERVNNTGGIECIHREYIGRFAAYRHGVINIIAVDCPHIWNGWKYAASYMAKLPQDMILDKVNRVAICEAARKEGELQSNGK